MRIATLFSILSFLVILAAAHIGDNSNGLWNKVTEEDGYFPWVLTLDAALVLTFLLSIVVGFCSWGVWLFWVYGSHDDDVNADDSQIMVGLTLILITFCFGYLYGFAVAPFSSEWAWLDGWLIFAFIGLLPAILNLNDSIGRAMSSLYERLR